MLIDRSGAKPKVLLGRRHASHKFMPGKFVFPGGRIEALDRVMPAASELHPDTQKKLLERVANPSDEFRARGLRSPPCARWRRKPGCCSASSATSRRRRRARSGPNSPRRRCIPTSAQIHFIARAITPPRRPKRFDTRFFTADASAQSPHTIEGVVGPDSELVELAWVPIEEATHLDMPTITGVVLEELPARVEAGMAPRPAGAVLFHDGAAVLPGTAVNATRNRAGFLDICRFDARFRANRHVRRRHSTFRG